MNKQQYYMYKMADALKLVGNAVDKGIKVYNKTKPGQVVARDLYGTSARAGELVPENTDPQSNSALDTANRATSLFGSTPRDVIDMWGWLDPKAVGNYGMLTAGLGTTAAIDNYVVNRYADKQGVQNQTRSQMQDDARLAIQKQHPDWYTDGKPNFNAMQAESQYAMNNYWKYTPGVYWNTRGSAMDNMGMSHAMYNQLYAPSAQEQAAQAAKNKQFQQQQQYRQMGPWLAQLSPEERLNFMIARGQDYNPNADAATSRLNQARATAWQSMSPDAALQAEQNSNWSQGLPDLKTFVGEDRFNQMQQNVDRNAWNHGYEYGPQPHPYQQSFFPRFNITPRGMQMPQQQQMQQQQPNTAAAR